MTAVPKNSYERATGQRRAESDLREPSGEEMRRMPWITQAHCAMPESDVEGLLGLGVFLLVPDSSPATPPHQMTPDVSTSTLLERRHGDPRACQRVKHYTDARPACLHDGISNLRWSFSSLVMKLRVWFHRAMADAYTPRAWHLPALLRTPGSARPRCSRAHEIHGTGQTLIDN